MVASTSTVLPYKTYGECSTLSYAFHILKMLLKLPFFIGYAFIIRDSSKPVTRTIYDALIRCISTVPYNVVQRLTGTTKQQYNDWSKGDGYIEDVPGNTDAKLMWIGQKETERVILYVHGGGYIVSTIPSAAPFWSHVKNEVTKRLGHDGVGVAVFSYSLIPTGVFPIPLQQLIHAISHLTASGTHASQIYLVGDSAGGNLILQLLAHSFHPVPSVPQSDHIKFGGIYLMSPWVDLLGTTFTQHMPHAAGDSITPSALKMYLHMLDLPAGFFHGLNQRILVSYGGRETLRDSIKLVLDVDGVHDDPYQNFNIFGARPKGALTATIIAWLVSSLSK
ncbi:alpha/beta-hydrolase [Hymenopellis radicata]|nr:alpha/beta-hydrolase [Hymenopellis radicata]